MNPSELRIGNWVYWTKKNTPRQITLVSDSIIHTKPLSLIEDFSDLKPIPLTEQWLIDFGMEMPTNEDPIFEHGKGEYNDCFNPFIKTSQSLIDASFEYDGKEFWADSNGFWFKIMHTYTHVEYVHQFQNLIFALTGKELTLQK